MDPLANGLGLGGAVLTTVGVLITLVGTRKLQTVIGRIRTWPATRRSTPVPSASGSGAAVGEIHAKGRTPPSPPAEGLTVEWVYETQQEQIDALADEIATHGHPKIDREIARVGEKAEDVRADALRRIEDLDTVAARAEKWNIWGLGFVGVGAALQFSALLVALN